MVKSSHNHMDVTYVAKRLGHTALCESNGMKKKEEIFIVKGGGRSDDTK